MGLDIYAGTLTRYYRHNWKTAAQQFAEANRLGFQMIRARQEELSIEEVREAVTRWRDNIIVGLELAKFAFSILWQAAEFSMEHGTVIVYDF